MRRFSFARFLAVLRKGMDTDAARPATIALTVALPLTAAFPVRVRAQCQPPPFADGGARSGPFALHPHIGGGAGQYRLL